MSNDWTFRPLGDGLLDTAFRYLATLRELLQVPVSEILYDVTGDPSGTARLYIAFLQIGFDMTEGAIRMATQAGKDGCRIALAWGDPPLPDIPNDAYPVRRTAIARRLSQYRCAFDRRRQQIAFALRDVYPLTPGTVLQTHDRRLRYLARGQHPLIVRSGRDAKGLIWERAA